MRRRIAPDGDRRMPYRHRGLNPKARRIDLCLHLGWQFRPAALGPLRDHGCRSVRVRCLPNFQAGSEAKLGHKWMLTRASASDDSPFRPNCHLTAETLEEHVPCGRCSRSPRRRRQVRSGLPAGERWIRTSGSGREGLRFGLRLSCAMGLPFLARSCSALRAHTRCRGLPPCRPVPGPGRTGC